jgi:hypothetical protein
MGNGEFFFEPKPESRINVGRLRLRWLEEVWNDLRGLKLQKWKTKFE